MSFIPYINIHTHHIQQAENVERICNIFPGEPVPEGKFSCGIHPWYINETDPAEQLMLLKISLQKAGCVALGECGLDKLKGASEELQLQMFREQVKLSNGLNKPLIIHCVKRFSEVLKVLKEERYEGYFILHGFNSNVENAKPFLTLPNALFSFGKALLNDDSNAVIALNLLPVERFFLETDDAYIDIKDIYEKAAAIKNISVDELKEKIVRNYKRIFENGIS